MAGSCLFGMNASWIRPLSCANMKTFYFSMEPTTKGSGVRIRREKLLSSSLPGFFASRTSKTRSTLISRRSWAGLAPHRIHRNRAVPTLNQCLRNLNRYSTRTNAPEWLASSITQESITAALGISHKKRSKIVNAHEECKAAFPVRANKRPFGHFVVGFPSEVEFGILASNDETKARAQSRAPGPP